MSKYSGVIGFAIPVEVKPGVWDDLIEEKPYKGDILQNARRWQEEIRQDKQSINDNLKVDNRMSLIADAYLYSHLPAIKYLTWMGVRWKVSNVEINRPRIILTIGDVYNAAPA